MKARIERHKFVLRLPDGPLHDRMRHLADGERRSVNMEYVLAAEWWADKKELLEALVARLGGEELSYVPAAKPASGLAQHLQHLDALVRDYPNTATLVELLKVRLNNATEAAR